METVGERAKRLCNDAINLLGGYAEYPSKVWRNGRLTDIAVWLARNAPGNTAITGQSVFRSAVLAYLEDEAWLPGSAQPFTGYESRVDFIAIAAGWVEPSQPSFYHTGRWYLIDAMIKLPAAELAAWGQGIPYALTKIVADDPNLESRVKAMELLDKMALPVTLYGPLNGALERLRDNLGALPGTAAIKQQAVVRLTSLRDRLGEQKAEADAAAQAAGVAAYAAQMAAQAASAGGAGSVQAAVAAAGNVPSLPPPFDWRPWATLGVTLGLVGGVVVALRRRARLVPAPAPALAAALPPVRQRLPAGSTVVLPSGKRAKVTTVAQAAGLIEAAGGGGRRHGAVRTGDVLDARGQRLAHVTATGAAKQADRSRALEGLGRASSALVYRPVGAKAEPYPSWVKDTKGKSGVYVIKQGGKVVYVGESHTGKLYQTMTRHFQTWTRQKKFWAGQYSSEHDPGVVYPRDKVEVAVRVLPAAAAIDAEERLIAKLKPRDNLVGQEEAPF